ncbi:MAG: hypothetical protein RLZZ546_3170 [Bacteroidota bacterium]
MAKELQNDDVLESQGDLLETTPKVIEDVEWCFQFFNNEPEVFAFSNEGEPAGNLSIELKPLEGEGLSFTHNGMAFRIFPREISEESKKARAAENEGKN